MARCRVACCVVCCVLRAACCVLRAACCARAVYAVPCPAVHVHIPSARLLGLQRLARREQTRRLGRVTPAAQHHTLLPRNRTRLTPRGWRWLRRHAPLHPLTTLQLLATRQPLVLHPLATPHLHLISRTPAESRAPRPAAGSADRASAARCGKRGARCGMRGARCGKRGARCGKRGARCGKHGARCGMARGGGVGLRDVAWQGGITCRGGVAQYRVAW